MSWATVSICCDCWDERNPTRPVRPEQPRDSGPSEQCVYCGEFHNSGIYVRANLDEVPHPPEEY